MTGSKREHRSATFSLAARQDIREILRWSIRNFGKDAADRYRALLKQAVLDIESDPLRPGSRARPELFEGARTYHLSLGRWKAEDSSVKAPRHFLLYQTAGTELRIARVLHEGRDLRRHVPAELRTDDSI